MVPNAFSISHLGLKQPHLGNRSGSWRQSLVNELWPREAKINGPVCVYRDQQEPWVSTF